MQVKVRRFNQHQGVPFLILTSAELPTRNCFVHKIICAKEKRLKFDAINVVVVDDFLRLKIKKQYMYVTTIALPDQNTVKLQWLEHFWNHENMFETEIVGANEC